MIDVFEKNRKAILYFKSYIQVWNIWFFFNEAFMIQTLRLIRNSSKIKYMYVLLSEVFLHFFLLKL